MMSRTPSSMSLEVLIGVGESEEREFGDPEEVRFRRDGEEV